MAGPVPAAPVFLARSPLFDRELRLAGYTLSGDAAAAANASVPARGPGTPLDVAVVDILAGGVPAWLTLAPDALLDRAYPMALRTKTVLVVPAAVLADQETVAACRDWRKAGFRLAVQDNPDDRARESLFAQAGAIRFDLTRGDPEQLGATLSRLEGSGRPLTAMGVDSLAAQGVLQRAGVAMFEGRFYTAPEAVSQARVPVSFGTVARLMSMLEQASLSDRAIEHELRADPSLSYKLLRSVNSAATGMRAVGSILHAIQIIGRNGLQRWLALLAVEASATGTAVERERRLLVLERARLCELIADGTVLRRHANSLFLAGMLAALQPMVGASPTELTAQVHVSGDVADALEGLGGLYAPVVQLANAYAAGNWNVVTSLGQQLRILEHLPGWYQSAVQWARESLARA